MKHVENAPAYSVADHDQSDDDCVMSYVYNPDDPPGKDCQSADRAHDRPGQLNPELYGKCNLELRGWNICAKHDGADVLPSKAHD